MVGRLVKKIRGENFDCNNWFALEIIFGNDHTVDRNVYTLPAAVQWVIKIAKKIRKQWYHLQCWLIHILNL